MKFKDFEIRPFKAMDGVINPKRFELVQWYKPDTCYVVAWLTWDDDGKYWSIESVAMRLMENWADGLDQFIIKWCEMATVCIEEDE